MTFWASAQAHCHKDYESSSLKDSSQMIICSDFVSPSPRVNDTIYRVDKIQSDKDNRDSLYIIQYEYRLLDKSSDSIDSCIKLLKENVSKKASHIDIDRRSYAIVDSFDLKYDGIAFHYAPYLYKNRFWGATNTVPCARIEKTGEYAIIGIALKKISEKVILRMSVYGFNVIYSGGITGGSTSFIPATIFMSKDNEKVDAGLKEHLSKYANKTAIDIFRYLNGGQLKLFTKCQKINGNDIYGIRHDI